MKNTIFLIALLLICSQSFAETDVVIFGEITLGKPLSIQPCEADKTGFGPAFNKTKETCTTSMKGVSFVRVLFPVETNMIAKDWQVVVWPAPNGNIEAAQFMTNGPSSDKDVMDALKAKYGKPTTDQHEVVQNGFGATFDSRSVAWVFKEISVLYVSVFDNVSRGKVVIQTKEGERLLELFENNNGKPKRSL